MKAVWKYEVSPWGATVKMPEGAKILHAAMQNDQACVWAEVDIDAPEVSRILRLMPTGIYLPEGKDGIYVDTVQTVEHGVHFVFHLYDFGVAGEVSADGAR